MPNGPSYSRPFACEECEQEHLPYPCDCDGKLHRQPEESDSGQRPVMPDEDAPRFPGVNWD